MEDSFARKTIDMGTNLMTKTCVKTRRHGAAYEAGMYIGAEKSTYFTTFLKIG